MKIRDNKGRGSTAHIHNRFEKLERVQEHAEGIDEWEEAEGKEKTKHLEIYPKSILNKINSPDVPGNWGINPYQGCEHGCSYCYARNTHEYWGYNASLDFERVVLYKKNAAQLLRAGFQKKSWKPDSVMLAGNTDCYQPLERKLKLTRQILEVFQEFKNPVSIVTKNALITRDMDILEELAQKNLVKVAISINGLDEKVRSKLEPRTSTYKSRLKAVETLSKAGIPVQVLMAPIIPGLNDHQIMKLAEKASEAGALSIGYTFIRLNGHLANMFSDWIELHFPDKANKVLSLIKQSHKGKLNDNEFGRRMRGDGPVAESVKQQVALARKKLFSERTVPEFDLSQFNRPGQQLNLFF